MSSLSFKDRHPLLWCLWQIKWFVLIPFWALWVCKRNSDAPHYRASGDGILWFVGTLICFPIGLMHLATWALVLSWFW